MQHIRHALFVEPMWMFSIGLALALLIQGQSLSAQEDTTQAQPIDQPQPAAELPQGSAPVSEAPQSDLTLASELEELKRKDKAEREAFKRRYRRYNSFEGATGGMHLVDPTSGAESSVRIQLGIKGFGASDFLAENDDVEQIAHSLSISWTPIELLEVYGSMMNRATMVDQLDYQSRQEDERFEDDFLSLGDVLLGLKAGTFVMPILSLGGDISIMVPSQSGGAGIQLDATNLRLRGDLTVDLRLDENPIPFIGRFNMDYLFDHSEALVDDKEDEDFNILYPNESNRPIKEENIEHFVSRVQRFGLGINRVDLFSLGLGIELPIEVAEDFYLHPMMEWRMSFPVNRRGFECPYREAEEDEDDNVEEGEDPPYPDDSCGNIESASAFPSTLGFGIRGVTPIRGISAMLGVDIGLTGTSTFVRELKPTAPYQVLFAVSYDYDARPEELRFVEPKVKPPPPKTHIKGMVAQQGAENVPIASAMVAFPNTQFTPLSTGEDGRFVSYGFDPGIVQMEVSHPDFEAGKCSAEIKEPGKEVEALCTLVRLAETGEINGRITDIYNMPIFGATISLSGAVNLTITTDQEGLFKRQLEPGDYKVSIDAEGYLIRITEISLNPRQTLTSDFVLVSKADKIKVSVRNGTIWTNTQIRFAKNSSELDNKGLQVVAQIADLMLRNPQIRKLKISGSNIGAGGDSMVPLTRALTIKRALVSSGVAPERIEAIGGDSSKVKLVVEE